MLNRFERFTLDIFKISHAWNKLATDAMSQYNLKGVSVLYLLTLFDHPEGITMAKLVEFSGRDKADVSRTVAQLEKKGLVERSKEYRYRVPLYLTEDGKELVNEITEKAIQLFNAAGQGITEEKRMAMYECFEIITYNLDNMV